MPALRMAWPVKLDDWKLSLLATSRRFLVSLSVITPRMRPQGHTPNGDCAKGPDARQKSRMKPKWASRAGRKGENRALPPKVIAQHLHIPERAPSFCGMPAGRPRPGEILLQDAAGKQVVELDAGP